MSRSINKFQIYDQCFTDHAAAAAVVAVAAIRVDHGRDGCKGENCACAPPALVWQLDFCLFDPNTAPLHAELGQNC